jgi:hypothetical protein
MLSACAYGEDYSSMRGANYVPSYAKNDIQTWTEYDGEVIDRELGYAEKLKLNTVRVFCNVAVYEKDSARFLTNFEDFLQRCDKHHIRAMPVLFDSCFDPQEVNVDDYRGKTWIPSPGFPRLGEKDRPAMRTYIRDVVGAYRDDPRIVMWDVVNEPESTSYWADIEKDGGRETIVEFVRWSLEQVRQAQPTQPLTIGWAAWTNNLYALDLVDVICVHAYLPADPFAQVLKEARVLGRAYGKPVIINEFAGRPGFPVQDGLKSIHEANMGWCLWELMIGSTQFTQGRVPYQGHIYPDGTCFSADEIAAILVPQGANGDAVSIAAQAGFHVSERVTEPYVDERMTFSPLWERWSGTGPRDSRLWFVAASDQTVEKEVEGTRVVVTVKKGPDCGYLTISVDGQRTNPAEINTYDPQVNWNHRIIAAENLPPGKHRVIVTALGRRDPASANAYVQVVGIDGE